MFLEKFTGIDSKAINNEPSLAALFIELIQRSMFHRQLCQTCYTNLKDLQGSDRVLPYVPTGHVRCA